MEKTNSFLLAEKHDIEVRYVDLSNIALGTTVKANGRMFILLHEEIKDSPFRYFICAHELYHALEHFGYISFYLYHNERREHIKAENEANKYAIKLITKMYIEDVDPDYVSIFDVLSYFGVPKEHIHTLGI